MSQHKDVSPSVVSRQANLQTTSASIASQRTKNKHELSIFLIICWIHRM